MRRSLEIEHLHSVQYFHSCATVCFNLKIISTILNVLVRWPPLTEECESKSIIGKTLFHRKWRINHTLLTETYMQQVQATWNQLLCHRPKWQLLQLQEYSVLCSPLHAGSLGDLEPSPGNLVFLKKETKKVEQTKKYSNILSWNSPFRTITNLLIVWKFW